MNTSELILQTKELQQQAYKVLDSLNLLNFLSNYGHPRIVGSLALGLMTWRDIDIDLEITEDFIEEDFWQTARYLLTHEEMTLISLVDNRKMIEKDRPPSMYIGGKYRDENKSVWKIDIRFISEQDAIAQKYVDHVRTQLTDSKKVSILSIKQVIAQDHRYRTEISSVDIYEAVLNKGITDLTGFKEHLRDQA